MIETWLGARLIDRKFRRLADPYFSRPFSQSDRKRCLIVYEPTRIAFAQIYPFILFRKELQSAFGHAFRFVSVDDEQRLAQLAPGADTILFEVWFSKGAEATAEMAQTLRQASPQATIAYVDCFAHSDIRWAKALEPYVDWYLKKSLLRDRNDHRRVLNGHNIQAAWYAEKHNRDYPVTDWEVPTSMLERLRLTPSFETAPALARLFMNKPAPPSLDGRSYDVQARFAVPPEPIHDYADMRRGAMDAIDGLSGEYRIAKGAGGLSWGAFIRELADSKLCFSPFGYGELCWRDQEAAAVGSVVLKQDMSHLETKLDLYEPYETYVPVKWDYSDVEEQIKTLLEDHALRTHIATTAFERIRRYLVTSQFVRDMAFLFQPPA